MQHHAHMDPLTIDVQKQWMKVSSCIRDGPEPGSPEEIVRVITHLLYDPRYTLLIAEKFRPILIMLCAQWLDHDGEEDAKLAALALLVNPHEELFPILSAFLRKSSFNNGLLENIPATLPTLQLQLRLLAYYRILVSCPSIPVSFGWSPRFLSHLISLPHPDVGVRWLAVRCYALHVRMTEVERDDIQTHALGRAGELDIPIEAGKASDGRTQILDGWILPALEQMRVREARQTMLEECDFYGQAPRIEIEQFTRRIVNVHGILLLKEPCPVTVTSRLVPTDSSAHALRELAVRASVRLPTLLSSPPSSGKILLLNHLASLLHPATPNQVVILNLADTSLEARTLMGSYVSSPRRPGTFEWQEGIIIHTMKRGLWLVLQDIDRASTEVLGEILPLFESLGIHKHIGAKATLEVPGHGIVHAAESFMVFATRSTTQLGTGKPPKSAFLASNKFSDVEIPPPTRDDLVKIISSRCPKLGMRGTKALIGVWEAVQSLPHTIGTRMIGIRELELWCKRVESHLRFPAEPDAYMDSEKMTIPYVYPDTVMREIIFLEARDVFFGAGAFSETARAHILSVDRTLKAHIGLDYARAEWVLEQRVPDFHIDKDGNGQTLGLEIGRTRLRALLTNTELLAAPQRPFAMHRPVLQLMERIASCVSFSEPVLLVGETGTGKTTVVSHIASLLNRKLVSLNLSHYTESSDLVGGFKPLDTRIPGSELQRRFSELFSRTFSAKKNSKFKDAVRKAVTEGKWNRAVGLWKESARLALEKIKNSGDSDLFRLEQDHALRDVRTTLDSDGNTPRKRRKLDGGARSVLESEWLAFCGDIETFDVQHVRTDGKFAFGFVEGPLVEALRNGDWVLLDEINLASPETLECICSVLRGPTASIVLAEQGVFSPVPCHPDFRLFACMNPATDVGKKDLPTNVRSYFTEIYVPPPDSDTEMLVAIIQQYIGHCAFADRNAIIDVAEFYTSVRQLAEKRELINGSNCTPHFSMRTLTRALTFTSDVVQMFGLRRALWEGFLMAFAAALDGRSAGLIKNFAEKHLLASVKNIPAMLGQLPSLPGNNKTENFERIGPFWLERGSMQPDPATEYILTPSVQSKLIDLARVVLTRRFPVLIEGPTSSGKTSAVQYLARRTGHRFVRINNHEHTDIQEYLGTYVTDPETGKFVFRDGILVHALRNGDWIVLDELNLAPTDVLEALNRLLDDNKELIIPETQEVIKPHPHFMLFATQNPPGLYAGRKVLSRALRNRFLEVEFTDVPQSELQTILSERCRIPSSYAQRIVSVFQELSKRRHAARVFETKHGFATLRDLFRWANREATSTLQLAQNGYMLLAERARRADDKAIVKEVIEAVMREHIDVDALYDLRLDVAPQLPPSSSAVVWTSAMKRLFMLVTSALRYNEPVLLVGNTGSGKTSVCQLYAEAASRQLLSVNCHQSTETADLIGGQRPVRKHAQSHLLEQAKELLHKCQGLAPIAEEASDVHEMLAVVKKWLRMSRLSPEFETLRELKQTLQRAAALFEWHDGPLVRAMRSGDIFLLDEISLADDSVLERLNSVLEPARTIILAERGSLDMEQTHVTAEPGFQLLATMNPGGDYGKKELSPALRNRFTEIWVPQVEEESDLCMILDKSWRQDILRPYTGHVLNFTNWISEAVGERSFVTLRDLLTWVAFSNEVCNSTQLISPDAVFHHAAHLVFLDGLESSPYTSNWPTGLLEDLRERGRSRLEQLVPLGKYGAQIFDSTFRRILNVTYFGAFGISHGSFELTISDFNLRAPTTLDNIRRLVRACQVPKPILLEGSPGVGKTSLVTALGNMTGHHLCRINLSDQTDLMDLFGSDLPVDDGRAGEFAWKDADFLRAMQAGDWVLLDEMNLAPQAVLEGLNAVLDHRGEVFIPELGRSFIKHPDFRIFAAQNPLRQGGGRKGLPRSFLDRFTRVHVNALSPNDFLLICRALFPVLGMDHLQSMILFNSRLHEETMLRRSFGRQGSPWEFNLRDVIRWATLLSSPSPLSVVSHPSMHLDAIYLQRFRTENDRMQTIALFCDVFSLPQVDIPAPYASTTPGYLQFGSTLLAREKYSRIDNSIELQHQLRALASASECINRGWLIIISGSAGAGKTHFVRYLASAAGRHLREFSMSSGTDTSDLLGSFEQIADIQDSAGRFEWRNGPLVEAVKEGYWLVLDNANLCNPSVLDRLNSLCETQGLLVLTERGDVHGQVVTLKPHPEFRLILTLDPRNGELSRAMRNRGVEIHLTADSVPMQDQLRIQNAIRTPLQSAPSPGTQGDELVVHFELIRRGYPQLPRLDNVLTPGIIRDGSWAMHQDSLSSAVLDLAILSRLKPSKPSKYPQDESYAHALLSLRLMPSSGGLVVGRMHDHMRPESSMFTLGILLDRLRHTSIWELRNTTDLISVSRELPFSFISNQAFDLLMNPNIRIDGGDNGFNTRRSILSEAIELFVHVHFHDHREVSDPSCKNSVFSQSRSFHVKNGVAAGTTAGVTVVFPLYASIMELAYELLKTVNAPPSEDKLSLITDVKHLTDIAEHLRNCLSDVQFDFSYVRVITEWLNGILVRNPVLERSHVCKLVATLADEVSLMSGYGMQEIWSNLVVAKLPQSVDTVTSRLDHLGVNLDPKQPSFLKLRVDALNVLSLITLKLTSSKDEQNVLFGLCSDIEQRLATSGLVRPEIVATFSHQLAIAELDFISTAVPADHSGAGHREGSFLIQLVSLTPGASLARVSQVQHYLWASDSSRGHPIKQMAIFASILKRWMHTLTEIATRGPALLLVPIVLRTIIQACRYEQCLGDLDSHEKSLRLEGQLAMNHCEKSMTDRVQQIVNVWKSVLVLIAECFKDVEDSERCNEPVTRTCSDLVELLSRSVHSRASGIILKRLLPLSHDLDRPQSEFDKINCLGKVWIETGLILLELYVPNVPLDPVAAQRCHLEFWKRREAQLLSQLEMYVAAEEMTTGHDDNPIISSLRRRLDAIRSKGEMFAASISRDVDINSLHALHRELTQFINHVIISAKFDVIVDRIEAGDMDVEPQVLMIRDTVNGFITRMELAYPNLVDIIQPVSLALCQLTFGLHLCLQSARLRATNLRVTEQLRTLVSFPTVAFMDSIHTTAVTNASPSTQLLLSTIATASEVRSPITFSDSCFEYLDFLNNQFTRLWLEDSADEEKKQQDTRHWYRAQKQDHNVQADLELEEQEFREMFPSFGPDDIDHSRAVPNDSKHVTHPKGRRVSDSDIQRLYRIHLWINDSTYPGEGNGAYDELYDLRDDCVSDILESHFPCLSQIIDGESLAYQVSLLSRAMKELKSRSPGKQKIHSFYHDQNISEARRAIPVIRAVQDRLNGLLKEWPDQMVLHHIKARCEAVLNLGFRSPIAKILNAVEQLLLQTEDWEMYAGRENTLKPQQEKLSNLIIEWRRFELSCWSNLLEAESLSFSAGTAEWWLRLYELTIRGTLAACAEGTPSLEAYFTTMIPLVEQFASTGPLGQYITRVRLLRIFSHYSEKLSATKKGSDLEALARASRILRNLHGFYEQFSSAVSRSLAEKRGTLEKEVSNFIKLASWKDVNVHALRQSALRTHRQLYKCIRNFREVLREPVTSILSQNPLEPDLDGQDRMQIPDSVMRQTISCPIFPIIPSTRGIPSHLQNLPHTFSRFKELMKSHGQPMINAVPFCMVEDLAGQIAETVTTLSKDTIAAGNNQRLQKTLLMKKRRAWVDLLKELKRAGLSSRLKPETLAQHQSKVWLMDRPTLILPANVTISKIVSKSEDYFYRILNLITSLRGSLASHHTDLPTRELERAVTYVESSISLALSARNRLATDYLLYDHANRVARRLRHLSKTQGEVRVACDLVPWLDLCCKLEDALREVSNCCADFNALDGASPLASGVIEAISARLLLLCHLGQSLRTVQDSVCLTPKGFMDSEELSVLDETRANVVSTKAALKSWMTQEPRIRHLCSPLLVWLDHRLSTIKEQTANGPSSSSTPYETLIQRLLLIAQDILAADIPSRAPDDKGYWDRYVADSEQMSSKTSVILSLASFSESISSFAEELILSSAVARKEKIQAILPFVDAYLDLVQEHLIIQAQSSKALLKLSYILSNVVFSVAQKGFCKPQDTEEGSEGHHKDGVQNGTGLGQGTGVENITNQIEDESQVEGLRGEESQQEGTGTGEDALEMTEDFEGDLEDIDNEETRDSSEARSCHEAEEQVGQADTSDLATVDEKLWSGDNAEGSAEEHTSKDGTKNQDNSAEIMGNKNDEHVSIQGDDAAYPDDTDESQHGETDIPEDNAIDAGKQMDDLIPESEKLDLPDDLNLMEDGKEGDREVEDDPADEGHPEDPVRDLNDRSDSLDGSERPSSPRSEGEAGKEEIPPQPSLSEENLADTQNSDPMASLVDIAQGIFDVPNGEAISQTDGPTRPRNNSQEKTEKNEVNDAERDVLSANDQTLMSGVSQVNGDVGKHDSVSIDAKEANQNQKSSDNIPNPLRSLADALEHLDRRFNQIDDITQPEASSPPGVEDAGQAEYLQENMVDEYDMQALGPAHEDQGREQDVSRFDIHTNIEPCAASKLADMEDASTNNERDLNASDHITSNDARNELSLVVSNADMDDSTAHPSLEENVELAVKEWQEMGHSDSRAAELWRLYSSLTQELSATLCEQLRLILEPTLATRLRGDYRTGKRLNMKKIIPYIASDFTKDKIWLRRTRPSQREYQILIALDDSRSMAESHSVHLAYETLALVSKALNLLESGEIAIARFGENVEMVHNFEDGNVGDIEGEKVMQRFRFEQRKTDVLGLVETSFKVLTQARERKLIGKSGNAADLWQLEIIISDGICQDHDKLRTVLRKANESHIMIVFIIVDSLHVDHSSSVPDKIQPPDAPQNTILSMNRVAYKDLGEGRMELHMERYLDSFPFQYYVVLRNIDALPDVLSATLKQFFERTSEE